MKKIVIVNQSVGYLFVDITNELAKKFDEVVLLTGNISGKKKLYDNIRIDLITPYDRGSSISRLYSWIAGSMQIFFRLKFRYKDHQVLISSNPPLATLLPLLCKNKCSMIIYDIYPDGLVSGGFVSRNNVIYKAWAKLNEMAYKKADYIISITKGMTKLLSRYVDASKVKTIPVWSDKQISEFNRNGKANQFISKFALGNKFVVMYSGNMGKGHALESLVQVANNLKHEEKVQFVIAGEGWKKKLVEEMVEELSLKNCLIMPYMPDDIFISSLYGIDLGVISLGEETSKIAIPSKTFNLLAAGTPLLCFANKDSDLSSLIIENRVGKAYAHHEIEEATAFIKGLINGNGTIHKNLSVNAKLLSKNYSYRNAEKIAELVSDS